MRSAKNDLMDHCLAGSVGELLRRTVEGDPHRPFLITDSQALSYGEFSDLSRRAATVWHELGVRREDRVVFMCENRPEFLWAWMGLARVGGILVALNTQWQPSEIGDFLELTQPRFALVSEPFFERFREATQPRTRRLETFVLQLSPSKAIGSDQPDFVDMIQRASPISADPPESDGDDEISFISTSGTTGRPKAVVQTHRNYVLTGEGYAHWVALRPHERIYMCLPLFHINAQAYTFMGAMAAGATIVLVERFSASRFWRDMKLYDVNVFNCVGSMMALLQKREPSSEERDHKVRLTYSVPALPGLVREETERRFGITIISGIGMSENTYGLIESLNGERRPGSLGTPRQHPSGRFLNEAKVVDDKGNEVPIGHVGELIYRNPVLMKGYFRDPAKTAEAIRDGWLYTGDLACIDEDGNFYFVDRKKDIIRVRGENVSSLEVEEILVQHPSVSEAAVIAVPAELAEDDVAAFVVPHPRQAIEAHEIKKWCSGRIAPFKVPRFVWLVESLPKTETQRVQKELLRAKANEMLKI